MEYTFKFNDLEIDTTQVNQVLGYPENSLPEPFDSYLETALNEARNLNDIKCTYQIINNIHINFNDFTLFAEQQKFDLGKAVCNELKGSDRIAIYICTSGKTISEKASTLLLGENPVLGYIYDILGSVIAEAACELMQTFLKKEINIHSEYHTNRYSPGYCQWPVADQHKLFSFFPENTCGVTLTESSLMDPVKSVSGIIGIGKNVKFREYICALCSSRDCLYRKTGVNSTI